MDDVKVLCGEDRMIMTEVTIAAMVAAHQK